MIAPTRDSVLFDLISAAVPFMSRWGWIGLVRVLVLGAIGLVWRQDEVGDRRV